VCFTRQINKEDNKYPFLGSHHPLAPGAAGWWDFLIACPMLAKKNAGGLHPAKRISDVEPLSIVCGPIAGCVRSAPTLIAVHRRGASGTKKLRPILNTHTTFNHRLYILIYYLFNVLKSNIKFRINPFCQFFIKSQI